MMLIDCKKESSFSFVASFVVHLSGITLRLDSTSFHNFVELMTLEDLEATIPSKHPTHMVLIFSSTHNRIDGVRVTSKSPNEHW